MRSVGLKILKNRLSEYVRVATGGETVLITDRDRVVAEIGPPRPERTAQAWRPAGTDRLRVRLHVGELCDSLVSGAARQDDAIPKRGAPE